MNAATLVAALLMIGCLGCMVTNGNLAILRKYNLMALGSVKDESPIAIFEVTIGRPVEPFDRRFAFSVRLSSGQAIKSETFALELIQSIATRTNALSTGEWGTGHVSYGVEGYSFVFQGDRLVSFKAAEISLPNGSRLSAILGDSEAQNFFPLPMSKEQLTLLFGKPDSDERRKVL